MSLSRADTFPYNSLILKPKSDWSHTRPVINSFTNYCRFLCNYMYILKKVFMSSRILNDNWLLIYLCMCHGVTTHMLIRMCKATYCLLKTLRFVVNSTVLHTTDAECMIIQLTIKYYSTVVQSQSNMSSTI